MPARETWRPTCSSILFRGFGLGNIVEETRANPYSNGAIIFPSALCLSDVNRYINRGEKN